MGSKNNLGAWARPVADLRRASDDGFDIKIQPESHSGLVEFIEEYKPKAGDLTVTLEGNYRASWSNGSLYEISIEFRSPFLCTLIVSDVDALFHLTATGDFERIEELTHHVGANVIMFEE